MQAAQVLADVTAEYLSNAKARVDASASVARLNHRGLHDPLTGLPNRTLLEELLEQADARAGRFGHAAGVLLADLDGFKLVNDRYGRHVGDQLLIAVAVRLTQALRPGDALARLAGDEFVVLCEDLHDRAHAETVAKRLMAALSVPFDLDGHEIVVNTSVGIAFSGPERHLPEALLRDAEFAMRQAKDSGGGRYKVMDPAARLAAGRRGDLERDLQTAQHRKQFSLVYQPIVAVPSGELAAVEALLRWHHPERGWVPPVITIAAAERTGMIVALGTWVLHRACQDLQDWRAKGLAIPSIAVNVSAHQVMGSAFPEAVARILDDTGVDPAAVRLEVTESVFLADAPRALAVLREVKELGVALSLDDFGTGYSSLSYLRHFPVDVVKIDRSFTAGLPTDEATRSIFSAISNLSHALGLTVTAEGVETPRELAWVTDLGADHVQGFYFSRPLGSLELADHFRKYPSGGRHAGE